METGYTVMETKDVLIPMRDGICLATNLYRPAGTGPVPAIVVYFPYLKDGPDGRGSVHDWQLHFAQRGYACLTVDFRGFGGSEGIAAPPTSPQERQDAYDMLDWIAAQPWCSGAIGMWGISYSGSTSLAAASLRPPALKAIIPMHATADEYFGCWIPHGCRPGFWNENAWGLHQVALLMLPPLHRDPGRRWARIWHERLEHLEPWPFCWHTISPQTYLGWRVEVEQIEAATYAVSAWHDFYPKATLDYFNAIPAPKRVLIGPWKHEFPDLAVNWSIDHLSEMDRWWDHWLKGVPNGANDAPPVMVWQQGEDVWRYERTWPPRRSEVQHWYAGEAGTLALGRPSKAGSDRYTVDPTVGLHMLPWDPEAPVVRMPYDRSADDHRSQTYTTGPLAQALEICGNAEADIALTSDQCEFPLSVWLSDVSPSGASTLICQGWINAAVAVGDLLHPDRVYTITVPLYSTSYRVPAGHRVRLGIAGAHFPLLWPAPRNATLTFHRTPQHSTCVRIPVAPVLPDPLPGPTFGKPIVEPSRTILCQRSHGRTIRDFVSTTAEYHRGTDRAHRLDDGSILRVQMSSISAVETARPDEAIFQGNATMTLERPVDAVKVTVDAIETSNRYHFEGRIEVDGKSFFARTWDMDLHPYGSSGG